VLDVVRNSLCGAGYFETATFTFTDVRTVEAIRPWSDGAPLTVRHSSRKHENALRQSLLPSLAGALRLNESRGAREADLFEFARIFVPSTGPLPDEQPAIGLAKLFSGEDKDATGWRKVRGCVEALFARLRIPVEVVASEVAGLEPDSSAEFRLDGRRIGVLGYLAQQLRTKWEFRGTVVLAELLAPPLVAKANLLATVVPTPDLPAVERDLAVVFDESARWVDVEAIVRAEAGAELESLEFVDLYRGKQVPAGKKSLAFRMTYRAADRTLTREEVDEKQGRIVALLGAKLGGVLRQ
jgi:phenylalanyl-tRNA synthetase beta chain